MVMSRRTGTDAGLALTVYIIRKIRWRLPVLDPLAHKEIFE